MDGNLVEAVGEGARRLSILAGCEFVESMSPIKIPEDFNMPPSQFFGQCPGENLVGSGY